VLLFLQRSCSSTPVPEPKIITETVTKWDTVSITKTEYIPKWKTRIETIHDTIPSSIDTVAILKDYYAKYFYTDTIQIDTLGSIVINDTITRNLIAMRDVQSNIFIPTTTITNTVYLNRREFYGGISLTGQPTQLDFINGELLYKGKKRNAYGIGVGINNELVPIYTFKVFWKIGK